MTHRLRARWALLVSVLVVLGACGRPVGGTPAADPAIGPAVAQVAATRGAPISLDVDCDLTTVAALASRHPEVGQWIVVRTSAWTDTAGALDVVERFGGGWRCSRGAQVARLGKAGTRPLVDRRSGDGTTPAGVFPLGTTTAWDGQVFQLFGNQPDPGVRGPYRRVRLEDCWGATPGAARYNHLVRSPGCASPDEWLARFGDVYAHAAVIGANTEPFVSGDAPGETPFAAAIFLHRHSYASATATKPTSGCVSLELADLVATLRLIDPSRTPRFAIGPTSWLRASA